tara:strand:- start:1877 stop:2719 length:843 start_codon:yes stop_codon:yes gene_type:complete
MKIHTAINKGTKILKENSILTADLDSEILMAKALNRDRKYIILNSLQKISHKDFNFYKKLISKRSLKKPVAQLTNKKFFWNSEFYVSSDTLIPRPETELIVENVIELTKQKNKLQILDIGIGSGCILISILKERKTFYGTGIDVSNKCLNISKINALNQNVHTRLKLFKSNVDKFLIGKYDLIVSNPPYINKNDLKYLEKDVGKYEPSLALDGGLEGLSVIRKVIKKSSELVKNNGKLILEIGFDQKNKVVKILKEEGFYINKIQKDLALIDRCIVCTKI